MKGVVREADPLTGLVHIINLLPFLAILTRPSGVCDIRILFMT